MPHHDELQADPFGERADLRWHRRRSLLGLPFDFRADAEALIALVDAAYSGLPAPALPSDASPCRIDLRLREDAAPGWASEPPEPRMFGGAGFFGAAMDAANLALVSPAERCGLVAASRSLLLHPYHARYELLEFAVFTLAARVQGLVPLHAACVGKRGAAALLIGESGAGKSTLALHALLRGMDFLTEDAAFARPSDLRVTGVANFLHLRADALRFVNDRPGLAQRIRESPTIRRRSGIEKFELDLRDGWAPLADEPMRLAHVVLVSPLLTDGELLRPLSPETLHARLASSQPYAASLPAWPAFETEAARLHGWELRRGAHPREAAAALADLFG